MVGIGLGQGDDKEEYIAVLKSRVFATEFIDRHDLLPILFADLRDPESDAWLGGVDVPTEDDAYRKFDRKVRDVSVDEISGLITLSIRWTDPIQAAKWANQMILDVNERLRQKAISETEKSLDFLRLQLEQTNIIGVRQAIYALTEDQIQKAMLARVREHYAFQLIDPAMPPDPDQYYMPKRKLFVALGSIFGLVAGVFVSILRSAFRSE